MFSDNTKDDRPIIHIPEIHVPEMPGINTDRLNPKIAIGGDFSGSSQGSRGGTRYFLFYIYQQTGTKPQNVFAPIRGGTIGDVYRDYADINPLGQGSMRAYISKLSTIGDIPISVKKGEIVEIKARVASATAMVQVRFSHSQSSLYGGGTTLSSTNQHIVHLANNDGTIDLLYRDNGMQNMILSVFLTIT